MTLFAELKRRNVFRVAIAYAIASWVLVQIIDVISPVFEIPEWVPKLMFIILAVGLVPALAAMLGANVGTTLIVQLLSFDLTELAPILILAGVWMFRRYPPGRTRDLGRVWRVSEALESGIVSINTGIISTEVAPFGGVKESGVGREGSKYGMDEFLEVKYLCMGGV